jgi:hypothetical protein
MFVVGVTFTSGQVFSGVLNMNLGLFSAGQKRMRGSWIVLFCVSIPNSTQEFPPVVRKAMLLNCLDTVLNPSGTWSRLFIAYKLNAV